MNRSALASAEAQYKTAKAAGDTEAMEHWSE
jgi:hypothetical protein